MATNNNGSHKKQKKTKAFDVVINGDDSISLTAPVVVVPALLYC